MSTIKRKKPDPSNKSQRLQAHHFTAHFLSSNLATTPFAYANNRLQRRGGGVFPARAFAIALNIPKSVVQFTTSNV